MSNPDDLSFAVETIDGSPVTGSELLDFYRSELEHFVKSKAAPSGSGGTVRIDAIDL